MARHNAEIRARIEAQGITQRQVAAAVGVHEVTLSRWLSRGDLDALRAARINSAIREIIRGR